MKGFNYYVGKILINTQDWESGASYTHSPCFSVWSLIPTGSGQEMRLVCSQVLSSIVKSSYLWNSCLAPPLNAKAAVKLGKAFKYHRDRSLFQTSWEASKIVS